MAELIKIALVGHTNTGKTSLLRTLTRDTTFGEVADRPGTTRHVEGARLRLDGRPVLEWFDTPGMEDSIALLEYLERLDRPGERLDGPARIRRFLDTPEAHGRFEQEARVLTKMLDCDAALYVIDARDPVLGKHRDELAILAACGRPLLPVLNFVNAPSHRADAWRDAMARLGLHAVVEFDTIAPPLDGEQQLYAKLGVLLDRHAGALARLSDSLAAQRGERHAAAYELVADLLIDVAALHVSSASDDAALAAASSQLRDQVRQREQTCVNALLALYNFRASDYADDALPLQGERWGMDLFHPQALKDMGVQVGMGAAAGAMAGAAVDLMSAGLSLGTGMLIGAAAGGLWQGVEKLGKRVAGKLRGYREISVDDAVLRLLALRQRQLIEALERRGHAAREPLRLDLPNDETWRKGPLPEALKEARSRPEWSALGKHYEDSDRRKRMLLELAKTLASAPLPAD
ncbi:DUF3482 domain-containing protein [Achromobacter mucicolens]|uniref:GTPase/DUF3482 domain-containing protein n=1 Tax=Achromobacter mucicolens TaxID=1389922 RepID=UPI0007C858E4|nr:GTPase/DUF3482 domain-containing protein [Achromobacter mucicolens]OAE57815.1 GTPase SAR1 [Achromobacter xylosoxidans]PTX09901.1 DUF3482 domain-containing protein [Achromobacter mucicolens]